MSDNLPVDGKIIAKAFSLSLGCVIVNPTQLSWDKEFNLFSDVSQGCW